MENAMVQNMSMAIVSSVLAGDNQGLPLEINTNVPLEEKDDQTENGHLLELSITDQFNVDTEADLADVISRYMETLTHKKQHFLGYPTNLNFNYDALGQLLNFHINNAGDPFLGNSNDFNSIPFELCVLNWFARLWEIEKSAYWGYFTTGGTEGNLHGILVGRELFPNGILYTSKDTHYSVFKIARMYRMECVKVGSLISGEIDYDDLKTCLLAHKDKPAIINLNIGTTVKGAVDDLDLVLQALEESSFTQDQFYIHCDGALFGIMLPFHNAAPKVTFKKPIGSITISGHKFLGCPIPCGVVITRSKYINALSGDVEYIASRDTTITGSRCGHAPIFLWYALNKKGLKGLHKEVQNCIKNAIYLRDRLRANGIGAMLNKYSSTVVLERPFDDAFSLRWSLACKGNISHVVVLQHVTTEMLDSFVSELVKNRSIWYQNGQNIPCIAEEIGAENCSCALHI